MADPTKVERNEESWSSLSLFRSPRIDPTLSFAVSATLDRNLSRDYSGIRLLIVTKDRASSSREIIIRGSIQTECHPWGRTRDKGKRRLNHREGLQRQRTDPPSQGGQRKNTTTHLFTVVLELIPCQPGEYWILEPYPSQRTSLNSDPSKIILFDASQLNSDSIFMTLECTAPVTFLRMHDPPPLSRLRLRPRPIVKRRLCPCGKAEKFPSSVYGLTFRSTNSTVRLPTISSGIAIYTITGPRNNSRTWRATLLGIGLVARSWAVVLDIFYMAHTTDIRHDAATLSSVASSLNYRPERATWMKGFSLQNYSPNNQPIPAFQRDVFKIIHHANCLENIEVYPTDPFLYHEYIAALTNLEKLETCIVSTSAHINSDLPGPYPSLDEILRLMQRWTKLTGLTYKGRRSERYSSYSVSEPPANLCRLQALSLTNVCVSRLQFLRLANPEATMLKQLSLSYVKWTNVDFVAMLRVIAQTLTVLVVMDCQIDRIAGEEPALDIMASNLTALVSLSAEGDVISWRALARPGRTGSSRPKGRINMVKCPDLPPEKVVKALERTRWRSISVVAPGAIDVELHSEMCEVARRRRLDFYWQNLS